ncbi:protein translocase subunit SecF [Pseudomonas monteilii]|uniref:Protein translocase subunit SecF n=1 Tax=Pseudomonas monteilii TaxID=76759 RepID=A0AAE6V373_9PSED|nr:protein translocase subunit SecF [Pseudomonas monteilii]
MGHHIRGNGLTPVMYAELYRLWALGQCYGDWPGMIAVVKSIGDQVGENLPHPGGVKLAKCLVATLQNNGDLWPRNAKLLHQRMAHL